MSFSNIGVVGLGIMGAGIVEVFARAGYEVTGVAESTPAVAAGQANLAKSLGRAVSKGKLSQEESDAITARVTFGSEFKLLANCDLVIEAAPEILSLKTEIFSQLDAVVKPAGILATMYLSISSDVFSLIGVLITAGASALTVIPIVATSLATPFTNPIRADLDVLYSALKQIIATTDLICVEW